MSNEFWFRVEALKEPGLLVVDCGYVNDQAARHRVERLRAWGIGKANVHCELYDRLLVRLPPGKAAACFRAFPELLPGSTYYGSTHHWQGMAPSDPPAPSPERKD